MSTLNDAIMAATGGPTVNDGMRSFFIANGGPSVAAVASAGGTLDDITRAFLGIVTDEGPINDMWMDFLGRSGYSGTLNDMQTAWWVSNGSPPELLSNGNFDNNTVWVQGGGWSISGGEAVHAPGAVSVLTQPIAFVAGETYEVRWEISALLGGIMRIEFNGTTRVFSTARSAPGVYVETMVAAAGNNQFDILASSPADGAVTSVSLKRSI